MGTIAQKLTYLEAYKAADRWSSYANRIQAIPSE